MFRQESIVERTQVLMIVNAPFAGNDRFHESWLTCFQRRSARDKSVALSGSDPY